MQSREKQPVSTVVSRAKILLSLLKINPFGKLTTNDLTKDKTHPFSVFRGKTELYSFPASQSEAAARVQENVRQFIGNYILVFVIFFLISLYKQPIPFLTLLASFPVTDYLDNLIIKKGLDQAYPFVRRLLFFISKLGIAALLMRTEVVIAFFFSLVAAYFAMLLHGALRILHE
ncbi:Prenylated rab acceptor PRA1 [Arabidopsis thaliana x Arabidopsis arenosa]|uniref:PRA1 family protein n=1 Tax=Arabidopsis thaliana x Arabidopsis arenosa TaxID=1240361 RepID=A0A8T2AX36_9BRAS|nr:Prenylated rab acceptor PRA1 [Arabidopsis thaliana x Arabidopsis arenosa]